MFEKIRKFFQKPPKQIEIGENHPLINDPNKTEILSHMSHAFMMTPDDLKGLLQEYNCREKLLHAENIGGHNAGEYQIIDSEGNPIGTITHTL